MVRIVGNIFLASVVGPTPTDRERHTHVLRRKFGWRRMWPEVGHVGKRERVEGERQKAARGKTRFECEPPLRPVDSPCNASLTSKQLHNLLL